MRKTWIRVARATIAMTALAALTTAGAAGAFAADEPPDLRFAESDIAPMAATAWEGFTLQSASQCPSGAMCFWSNTGFTTGFWKSTTQSSVVNIGATVTRAMVNKMGKGVTLYTGAGATGTSRCIAAGYSGTTSVAYKSFRATGAC